MKRRRGIRFSPYRQRSQGEEHGGGCPSPQICGALHIERRQPLVILWGRLFFVAKKKFFSATSSSTQSSHLRFVTPPNNLTKAPCFIWEVTRVLLPGATCLHYPHSASGCASTSVSTRRMNASNSSKEWNRATW